MKPCFVVNPNSANGSTRDRFRAMEPSLRRVFPDMDIVYTTGPMHAAALAAEAAQGGADMVVACGGDGTLNEVVGGLVESGRDVVLALAPSGTGGDFRRLLGLSREPDDLVAYLAGGEPIPVDTGRLEYRNPEGKTATRAFMNIASCGISGIVDHYVNSTSKALGGKASFFIGSLRGMLQYRNVPMKVTVDGDLLHEGPTNLVAAANGRFFGGGMMVAPESSLDDGLLDVVVFGDLTRLEFVGLSNKIYAGAHLGHPKIRSARGRSVTVETVGSALIDLDGEQVGVIPMTATVNPSSLRLLIPKTDSPWQPLKGVFTGGG